MNVIYTLVAAAALAGNSADHGMTRVQAKMPSFSVAAGHAAIKQCSEKLARDVPKLKIVGSFSILPSGKIYPGGLDRLFDRDPREIVGVFAPSTNLSLLGVPSRRYAGCSYYVGNGTLTFRRLEMPNFFPRRLHLMPGEQ